MKTVLTFLLAAFSISAFPSGSTVGNGFVGTNDKQLEKSCTDKGGTVDKDSCVLKDKTIKLKDLVEAPKKEEGKK